MSTRNSASNKSIRAMLFAALIITVLLGALTGCAPAEEKVLTHSLSEPLNGATSAKVEISAGSGNLTVDKITGGEALLANGTLEYTEKQGPPASSVSASSGQASLTVKADAPKTSGIRLPWEACNGQTDWNIHLNPGLPAEINAHSGGGNVKLDLSGMAVTRLSTDTGGGNIDLVLPEKAAALNVTAKTGAGNVVVEIGSGFTGASTLVASSGAGNVVVRVPASLAARITVSSGMGKGVMDARFIKIDDKIYQTADYESAANKVEITLSSGAGDVVVNSK